MFKKPKRTVDKVFLHCSASDKPSHDDIQVIRNWHVDGNGWSDVGYHFFIKKNGQVQAGRDLERIPAAQAGYNEGTIAICLHGLLKENFTASQAVSLIELCNEINDAYKGDITFHGHKEVSNKDCPVIDYKRILNLNKSGYMMITNERSNIMKQFVPYIAGAVIAVGAFFTGSVTEIGTAFKLAFDKEALKVECSKLVDGE